MAVPLEVMVVVGGGSDRRRSKPEMVADFALSRTLGLCPSLRLVGFVVLTGVGGGEG